MKKALQKIDLRTSLFVTAVGVVLGINGSCVDRARTIEIRKKEASAYKWYKSINLKQITDEEKADLEEMKKTHGKFPIPASRLRDYISSDNEVSKNYEAFFGKKKYGEKELIFLRRYSGAVAHWSTLMWTQSQNN